MDTYYLSHHFKNTALPIPLPLITVTTVDSTFPVNRDRSVHVFQSTARTKRFFVTTHDTSRKEEDIHRHREPFVRLLLTYLKHN